ncbi:HAAS signaling domain-containing protein [Gorillibacterium timonense]|uniref:HAAS signaling domain-containing protein n=1 Tax=Gorillibacterium timonense TaxID=1689269 RepID=UPI00071E49EB|nr:hypothetical protein [Gorillibacterium timonense]
MNDLIERYVYGVTHHLPEKDRDEVSKELRSNIYDMLSEHPTDEEITAVLYKLGSPASLAVKYQQKPRYLISPAIYGDYVRTLKFLLPLVGVVALVIGMMLGAVDAIKADMVDVAYFTSHSISKGISMGIAAVFQALLWTTIGYVIAERTRTKAANDKGQEWSIEDLPEIPPNGKNSIPLSDSIMELVMTVVFSVVAILICRGVVPLVFLIQNGDTQIRTLFSSSFLQSCIPAVIGMALIGIFACICKIKDRRWTPFVCIAVMGSSLINMGIVLFMINKPDIFSTEFIAFLQSKGWDDLGFAGFMGSGETRSVIALISTIIVVCTLVGCGKAVYKTMKSKNQLGL